MLERRDEGAVEGLSPRRTELLLRLETVTLAGAAVLEDPRTFPGGFSGRFPRDGAPLLALEMGTTRLMPWFSELVRVRTGLLLLVAEEAFGVAVFVPAGRVFEVGRLLVDGLDEGPGSAFLLLDEAVSVFPLAV